MWWARRIRLLTELNCEHSISFQPSRFQWSFVNSVMMTRCKERQGWYRSRNWRGAVFLYSMWKDAPKKIISEKTTKGAGTLFSFLFCYPCHLEKVQGSPSFYWFIYPMDERAVLLLPLEVLLCLAEAECICLWPLLVSEWLIITHTNAAFVNNPSWTWSASLPSSTFLPSLCPCCSVQNVMSSMHPTCTWGQVWASPLELAIYADT